jgi:hypothetical protein
LNYEELLKLELGTVKYEAVSVELGENWQVIAEIFFDLGYEEGLKDALGVKS